MKIQIQPISIYTSDGVHEATKFEVRHVTYVPAGGAHADTHLFREVEQEVDGQTVTSDVEVGTGAVVTVSQADCDTWTDDEAFFQLIASRINLTPIIE